MPAELRFAPAPRAGARPARPLRGCGADLLLRQRRRARKPPHEPALLVGHHQQRRVDRARGVGLLELRR